MPIKRINGIDLVHAVKSAERFHSATVLLGSKVMGESPTFILERNVSLPSIFAHNEALYKFYAGTQKGDAEFVTPYIVNASFSLELHLKLLSFLECKKWSQKHRLDNIYDSLQAETRSEIGNSVVQSFHSAPWLKEVNAVLTHEGLVINWTAEELLRLSSNAFVKWRYAFESFAGTFAGYSELQYAFSKKIRALISVSSN